MSEGNKHMDDRFKHLDEELNVNYTSSFWDDALKDLENTELDAAFQTAAISAAINVNNANAQEHVADAFLDDGVRVAAENSVSEYNPSYWTAFLAQREIIEMDEAFVDAASQFKMTYHPAFWNEANTALENEGLAHEYKPDYWQEAKTLLVKNERKTFFFRWSLAASILLLLSITGLKQEWGGEEYALNKSSETENKVSTKTPHKNQRKEAFLSNKSRTTSPPSNKLETKNDANNISFLKNKQVEEQASEVDQLEMIENNAITEKSSENSLLPINSDLKVPKNEPERIYMRELNDELANEQHHLISFNRGYQQENLRYSNDDKNKSLSNEIAKLPVGTSIIKTAQPSMGMVSITRLKLKPSTTVNLFAAIGGGNNYQSNTFSPNNRYTAGFEVLRGVAPNRLKQFEYGIGAQLNSVKIADLGVQRSEKQYLSNGTVDRAWYKLKYRNLIYLNVNALFQYYLTPKHLLKFGVGVERLISVQSNLAFQNDAKRGIQTVNNNWGVTEGVNPYDVRISLGYTYKVNNRVNANLNAGFGVMDRTNNEFLMNNSFDRELNLMVGLNYTLFRTR
jgi:hypothetical protein